MIKDKQIKIPNSPNHHHRRQFSWVRNPLSRELTHRILTNFSTLSSRILFVPFKKDKYFKAFVLIETEEN